MTTGLVVRVMAPANPIRSLRGRVEAIIRLVAGVGAYTGLFEGAGVTTVLVAMFGAATGLVAGAESVTGTYLWAPGHN